MSLWSHVCILELSISEAGGGKDLTDRLIQKQKQLLAEAVKKKGGSVKSATEAVQSVLAGQEESGGNGSCVTAEFAFERSLQVVTGGIKGALSGISSLYHFMYEYDDNNIFVGLRVFTHEGIGDGKIYSASECTAMWEEEGGLTEEMCGETTSAESQLPQGDIARDRAAGCGARLLKGSAHKVADADAHAVKKASTLSAQLTWKQDQEALLKQQQEACDVMFCRECGKAFQRRKCFQLHQNQCTNQPRLRL